LGLWRTDSHRETTPRKENLRLRPLGGRNSHLKGPEHRGGKLWRKKQREEKCGRIDFL